MQLSLICMLCILGFSSIKIFPRPFRYQIVHIIHVRNLPIWKQHTYCCCYDIIFVFQESTSHFVKIQSNSSIWWYGSIYLFNGRHNYMIKDVLFGYPKFNSLWWMSSFNFYWDHEDGQINTMRNKGFAAIETKVLRVIHMHMEKYFLFRV